MSNPLREDGLTPEQVAKWKRIEARLPLVPYDGANGPAERIKIEHEIRWWLWIGHGCPIAVLYGDDGEMQCSNEGHHPIDFKRLPVVGYFQFPLHKRS